MNTTSSLTPAQAVTIFGGIALLIVGVYDVYAGGWIGPDYTVSRVILDSSKKWPLLPFLTGLLVGHLFWPQ
jgi:hypothetical protein